MAKNGNGKFWLKLLVSIGIILIGVAVGYGMLTRQVNDNTTSIKTVKTEGCLPARQSKTDIQIIQKDVEIIKGSQKDMEDTQKDMNNKLDELLRRP